MESSEIDVITRNAFYCMRRGPEHYEREPYHVRFYHELTDKLFDVERSSFVVHKLGKLGYFFKVCDLFEMEQEEKHWDEIDEATVLLFKLERVQIVQLEPKEQSINSNR